MAALVNTSSSQHWTGTNNTSQATSAFALTAGNLLIVTLRLGSSADAADVSVSDTAGNRFEFVAGSPSDTGGRDFIWFAENCLGNATNVVTAVYPSRAWTSITAAQFSGAPASIDVDSASNSVASGLSVSCTPISTATNQIAIAISDTGGNGLPSFSGGSWTELYHSVGPPGIGSHGVKYNINTTDVFDGSVTVTATYTTTLTKAILVAVFRLATVVTDPESPIDYEDPCTITDPRVHVKVTTEDETLHYGVHPLRDAASRGGFKEPRVIAIGPITRAASDLSTGAWSAQTATVTLADTDRVNRERSQDRTSFRNCDAEIYLASKAQQLAGGSPRILFSGKVYSDTAAPNLALQLTINDLIGIDYSLFSEEKMIPQRVVLREDFPDAPEASVQQGVPILGGRLAPLNTDDGEGVVDCLYLGAVNIGGTPTPPTGITLADLVALLQTSKDAGTLYSQYGGIFGFADCQSLQDYSGSVPSDYDELCGGTGSFVGLGYSDVDAYLANASVSGATSYVACLVAGHAISEVLDGANGNPSIWIDDTQIDPGQIGVSVWCPKISGDTSWSSTFGSDPFTDITSSSGDVRRYTLILFDAASAYGISVAGGARVHLDCIGLEDEGDGTGDPITDYFALYLHVLTNFILQNYQTGAWLDVPTFLFADGTTVLDRIKTTSFTTASSVVAADYLSSGYLGSFKIGQRTSVRDVIQKFNFSGGCLLGQDDFGRLLVKVLDTRRANFLQTTTGDTHRTLRDKIDILPGFTIQPKPEWQANWIAYQYAQNYYTGSFERPASGGGAVAPVQDTDSQDRDGVIKKTLTFDYVRDDATAEAVAEYYLSIFKDLPRVAKYARRGLCGLEDDILQGVPITHYNGYGASGWVTNSVWILQKTFNTKTMTCEFIAFDAEPVITDAETVETDELKLDPVALETLFDDSTGEALTVG